MIVICYFWYKYVHLWLGFNFVYTTCSQFLISHLQFCLPFFQIILKLLKVLMKWCVVLVLTISLNTENLNLYLPVNGSHFKQLKHILIKNVVRLLQPCEEIPNSIAKPDQPYITNQHLYLYISSSFLIKSRLGRSSVVDHI